jgi:hypothetical protein
VPRICVSLGYLKVNLKYVCNIYIGLIISPSGISDSCGAVAGMVTPKDSMSTEGETLQVSVLPYMCSICAPLVTRQMSNFGKFQDTDRLLFPVHAMFRHDCPPSCETCKYTTAPSTKKLGEILCLLICSFLPCVSWLLRSRVRKSRRDL